MREVDGRVRLSPRNCARTRQRPGDAKVTIWKRPVELTRAAGALAACHVPLVPARLRSRLTRPPWAPRTSPTKSTFTRRIWAARAARVRSRRIRTTVVLASRLSVRSAEAV